MIPDDAEPRIEEGELPRDDVRESRIVVVVVAAIDPFVGAAPPQGGWKDMLTRTCRSAADDAGPGHKPFSPLVRSRPAGAGCAAIQAAAAKKIWFCQGSRQQVLP